MNFNLKKKMRLYKKITKFPFFQSFLAWLVSVYIKFCFHSSSWKVKDFENIKKLVLKKKKIIVCFWHGRLLMSPLCWNFPHNFYMLISDHSDGKLISKTVSHFQINTIVGSSSKKKISSTKSIISKLKNNEIIGITPDGPRGPKMKIKSSLASLAKVTNATIIPMSISSRFSKILSSWDNFNLVTPFNNFYIIWGKPINYKRKYNLEKNRLKVENELLRITKLSDTLANQK